MNKLITSLPIIVALIFSGCYRNVSVSKKQTYDRELTNIEPKIELSGNNIKLNTISTVKEIENTKECFNKQTYNSFLGSYFTNDSYTGLKAFLFGFTLGTITAVALAIDIVTVSPLWRYEGNYGYFCNTSVTDKKVLTLENYGTISGQFDVINLTDNALSQHQISSQTLPVEIKLTNSAEKGVLLKIDSTIYNNVNYESLKIEKEMYLNDTWY